MVCPDDYEPKEPQIEPLNFRGDAIAISDPRPDRTEPVVVFAGTPGDSAFQSIGTAYGSTDMQPFPLQKAVEGVGEIGTVDLTGVLGQTFTVTVASGTNEYGTGNKFYIDGAVSPTLSLTQGRVYTFDQSAGTNSTHPLRFSTTPNGTWGGGVEYTTGVVKNGVPGNSGAYTRITVAIGAPTLYYYCSAHSGMGGQANTP
tara:strand:- start:7140 stop:7739 length:600 start_codon:yes stop_codon:yes gene_type:complete